ncbi:TonB-dependent receptor domain-containing protein [Rufibacter roseus]|uniref:TonB-dependent receptor domain-containing protein n=1 Tax=Rufibacter roseus TaxID=1567108 RepID=A0ABW2DNY4_9BACT|nr:TonB-dependent receptor [Rufibacter roseus]
MKKAIYVFLLVLGLVVVRTPVQAQEREYQSISKGFENTPLPKVLDELQQITGYRFFYRKEQLDSIRVNISVPVQGQPLVAVLDSLSQNYGVSYAIDAQKNVFVLKGGTLVTDLPKALFQDTSTEPQKELAQEKKPLSSTPKADIKATVASQENKIYEIGSRTAPGAGRVTLSGVIYNSTTGKPVAGASVFFPELNTGVTADQNGAYTITLPRGRHEMLVKSIEVTDARRQLVLYSDGKLNIETPAQNTALKEVVVQAEAASNVQKMQMGMERLEINTIKQVPTVFGEADVLKVVLTLPGVKSVGEASGGFNVRGGSTDQNLILFNGATVYNPSHFFGFFSAFNPELIKDVELFKSSIPAKYGGRLSSVLNVNTRTGNKEKFTGSAGIGLLTSRIHLEGPINKGKTSFLFGARTTYSNWLFNLLPDDSDFKGAKASFYDINLNLDHQVNDKNFLTLTGYLSHDESNLNTDTLFSYGNRNLSLKWQHDFTPELSGTMVVGHDHYRYSNYSEANPMSAYRLAFQLDQSNVKTDFTYRPSSDHTLSFGVSSIYYQLKPGSYEPLGAESVIAPAKVEEEQALESAIFLEDNFAITPRLSLNAGIRYSIYNYLGPHQVNYYAPEEPRTEESQTETRSFQKGDFIKTYHGPEYRVSARFAITENLSVKAGYNTLRQYIHMLSNTTAIAPTDIWKLSDPNIRPQHSEQMSVGVYQNLFLNKLELSAEFYNRKITNYLDYKSAAVLVMNPHIETDVLNTQGKAYGAELMVRKKEGKFNGWMSYTYSRILLRQDDPNAGETINGGDYYPASYDKPHDFTFVGNQQLSRRFSISMNVTYSTGRPVTIPVARFMYGGTQKTLFSGRNDYRIPDYFRADLSINLEGNHKIKQLTHNSWTLGVYNLTGRKNPYSVYFTTEGGQIKGYKLSVFGAAVPFLNFNIRF